MAARILVVEDNPTNVALMEYLLRAFGYDVLTAADGVEGVARARRETPDVILMDLQMPKMNGYDAVAQIKAMPALETTPVVAVTAFAMVGDRDRILSHGFDGYIPKPIAPETFVAQVEAFLPEARRAGGRPAQSNAEPPPRPARRNRTILVIDNSLVNLALVKSILGPFGYDVVTAGSVDEGLEIARRQAPDLILSDVHMPGQSGYDLIRIVKSDDRLRGVPFAFISSTVWGEKERELGLRMGAHRFILRPIEPEAFIAEIEACLREQPSKQ